MMKDLIQDEAKSRKLEKENAKGTMSDQIQELKEEQERK